MSSTDYNGACCEKSRKRMMVNSTHWVFFFEKYVLGVLYTRKIGCIPVISKRFTVVCAYSLFVRQVKKRECICSGKRLIKTLWWKSKGQHLWCCCVEHSRLPDVLLHTVNQKNLTSVQSESTSVYVMSAVRAFPKCLLNDGRDSASNHNLLNNSFCTILV